MSFSSEKVSVSVSPQRKLSFALFSCKSAPVRALSLKPNHKRVAAYHESLAEFQKLGVKHESAVRAAFQALLEDCTALVNKGREAKWKLVPEFSLKTKGGAKITPDGVILDSFRLVHGVWEAKDTTDDLDAEIRRKFKLGYPRANTLFQAPQRAVLVQDGERVLDVDLAKPSNLVEILKRFFEYQPPEFDEWEKAVAEFKERLPEIGRTLTEIIRREEKKNAKFAEAFQQFVTLCRQSLNPNLRKEAVEEMLVQHLLTERIFRRIFGTPDFMQRNNIAQEIEKVIATLTSRSFSRDAFLKELNRFYKAIEDAADTIPEFSEKQKFLNTVYEQFFQGFAVDRADTLGIVYTPQEIVDFMLASVQEILRKEFGRELGDKNVHIIDPFVGTGNFMVNLIRRIPKTQLEYKYREELHCNEVMLLPYYVATMNIEHTFLEQIGRYEPFPGICLVDTFETAEKEQHEFPFFNPENAERVKRQKAAPIFVVIGNPPYNAHQVNENDNNKNRRYEVVDSRVRQTYTRDSTATNKNALSDPYVKAWRWASDRIGNEGIVAYVCNNSFIDDLAFDGVRKHFSGDFNALYVLDLGANVRKNPKLSGTTHNVFGIQVGVSVNVFVRGGKNLRDGKQICYHTVPVDWTRSEKTRFVEKVRNRSGIEWGQITADKNGNWISEGVRPEFRVFFAISERAGKAEDTPCVFRRNSRGVATSRDDWTYGFDRKALLTRIEQMTANYNAEVKRWTRHEAKTASVDEFVGYDDRKLKWSRDLKQDLERGTEAKFSQTKVRTALYRPFTRCYLYFDRILNEEVYQFPEYFPDASTERENRAIAVTVYGRKHFAAFITDRIVDLNFFADPAQCFPFYTYDGENGERRENIPLSTLVRFQQHYDDEKITKWDIFHYVYAVLHHPDYRTRYAANLRRELPRIPFVGKDAKTFHALAEIGRKLADLHANYEDAAEYKLKCIENRDERLNWRVEKMRLTKDKRAIIYNEFLRLDGIPPEVFAYRLGNRSALEWVIDQYQVSTDKRSGITNDPNREDEPDYIVKLIGKVITVSLETQNLIAQLPPLEIERS
jgi:predicted helicase